MNSSSTDENNRAHVLDESTGTDAAVFASVEELQELAAGWPMRRLVEIWNGLPGVRALARFENRKVAAQRIWQALQAERRSDAQPQPGRKRKRQAPQTKLQLVLRLLRAPEGTTLETLMKATRWQAHSVRGFLSGKVSKQLALPVESFRRDGSRVYRLPTAQ